MEWIKMRVQLDRDPKVSQMSRWLSEDKSFCAWLGGPFGVEIKHAFEYVTPNVTRDIVISALLRFWGVAIAQGKRDGDDLLVNHCNSFDVSEIANVPSFGAALEHVGWAVYENGESQVVRLPRFLVENTPVSERRKEASRKTSQAYRDRKKALKRDMSPYVTRDIDRDTKRDTRPDQIRLDPNLPVTGMISGFFNEVGFSEKTLANPLDLIRWYDQHYERLDQLGLTPSRQTEINLLGSAERIMGDGRIKNKVGCFIAVIAAADYRFSDAIEIHVETGIKKYRQDHSAPWEKCECVQTDKREAGRQTA